MSLEIFDPELEARRLYDELINEDTMLTSYEQFQTHWVKHDGRRLEVAVLRLWMGLSDFPQRDELGTAVCMLFADGRLAAVTREGPLLLFHDYLRDG